MFPYVCCFVLHTCVRVNLLALFLRNIDECNNSSAGHAHTNTQTHRGELSIQLMSLRRKRVCWIINRLFFITYAYMCNWNWCHLSPESPIINFSDLPPHTHRHTYMHTHKQLYYSSWGSTHKSAGADTACSVGNVTWRCSLHMLCLSGTEEDQRAVVIVGIINHRHTSTLENTFGWIKYSVFALNSLFLIAQCVTATYLKPKM